MIKNFYHHHYSQVVRTYSRYLRRHQEVQQTPCRTSTTQRASSIRIATNATSAAVATTDQKILTDTTTDATSVNDTTTTRNEHTSSSHKSKRRPRLEALRHTLHTTIQPQLNSFTTTTTTNAGTHFVSPSSSPSRQAAAASTTGTTGISTIAAPDKAGDDVVVVNKVTVSSLASSYDTTSSAKTASAATSNNSSTVIITPDRNKIGRIREMLAQIPDPSITTTILRDRHERFHNYLRISVSERCNLRCTYCMPANGIPLQPKHQLLTTPEILQLASIFTRAGVNKFRITGGEPTLRSDLTDIISGLKQLPLTATSIGHSNNHNSNKQQPLIGMTTNGITLYQHIHDYVNAGLSSVNISLDTLDATKFSTLTRRPPTYLQNVLKSIESAVQIANDSNNTALVVKINCVVMRGTNETEIIDFIRLTNQYSTNLQIRFIEYMPFTENGWNTTKFIPYQEIIQSIHQKNNPNSDTDLQLIPIPSDDPHDTTKWYTTTASDNHHQLGAKIGFITSMSQHFCASCNRLRLTADGQLKVCLFDGSSDDANNNTNISLRDALRNDFSIVEMQKLIALSVQKKHAILGGHTDPIDIMRDASNNRPMTLIGG